jgi:predicted secreted Zn-dependent protease
LLGPLRNGRRVPAHTDWTVRWSYVPLREGDRVRVGAARVDLAVETTLPEWRAFPSASSALRCAWRDLSLALEVHERGHCDVGVAAANALAEALAAMDPQPDAHSLACACHAVAEAVMARHRLLDVAHDAAAGARQSA